MTPTHHNLHTQQLPRNTTPTCCNSHIPQLLHSTTPILSNLKTSPSLHTATLPYRNFHAFNLTLRYIHHDFQSKELSLYCYYLKEHKKIAYFCHQLFHKFSTSNSRLSSHYFGRHHALTLIMSVLMRLYEKMSLTPLCRSKHM